MRIAISSVVGPPDDPHTWSSAPWHMIKCFEALGHECIPIDSSHLSLASKAIMAVRNLTHGYPLRAVSWFSDARRRRARFVARTAIEADCDLLICSGSLDAPVDVGDGCQIDYAIWLDNTFALLQRSTAALPYSAAAVAEIERLEGAALSGARVLLPFSEHVRHSIIYDYGVSADRVHAIGCGSGALPPFEGEKDFARGHLLFVAKHHFSAKGGNLLLEAFPLISAERPETKLILVGNDEACEKARGIDGVEAHGFVVRDVLNRYYHDAAMLVQPMLSDPWGQVYLEAMKARAVVVSLNVAALPELTENGRLGVLVDTPEPRKLADAVLRTYARPQGELDRMTLEAQERVIRLHSWEAVGERASKALGLDPGNAATQ
jgi:glycosyltransferase involved in cell wall biosynthesis